MNSFIILGILFLTIDAHAIDYEKEKLHYQQQTGYNARFSEGVACYRLKDFPCAMHAFAKAAWDAKNESLRGRALFNLANTHFFMGDFQQASVLFQEAGFLGVDANKIKINKAFADSLSASVRKQLRDIQKSLKRAARRADANDLPDFLDGFLANAIYLSRPDDGAFDIQTLNMQQVKLLLANGLKRLKLMTGDGQLDSRRQWVKSTDTSTPGNTASVFNRLIPMELGMSYVTNKPYRLKGHRPW